ncbi:MAG: FAD-binding protein, partial [Proteobacteria bacterium]|nr:FAD-binding protein [Pseudomonadota bacterium]
MPDSELAPVGLVTPLVEQHVWLEHQADALVVDSGTVLGATFTDLITGEQGWIEADATVVATGGFVRDRDRLLDARPELADLTVVFEAAPTSDGGGHAMLEEVGAQTHNLSEVGVYAHSLVDPRTGFEDEALWPVPGLMKTLVVDLAGTRIADESESTGFGFVEHLLAAPDHRLLALYPSTVMENVEVRLPHYNRTDVHETETVALDELEAAGVFTQHASVDEAAAHWGVDAKALLATLQRYDELAAGGKDLDHGKDANDLVGFGDQPFHVLEVVAGAAKAFGGVLLDTHGRVLDADGEP